MSKIKSKRVKFGLGMLWLFVLVLVLLWSFYTFFKNSIHFDPEVGINLIAVSDNRVGILAIRPGDEPSSFVKLPEDLLVKAYGTDGEYKVGKLWDLGELEKIGGREMVDKSIGDALGFLPGGFIKMSEDSEVSPLGVMSELANPLAKTNLWWWDRFVLWKMIRDELSNFSLLNISLPEQVYQSFKEADGVVVNRLASESVIDSWGRKVWLMETILSESAQVEVFNYSGRSGEARQAARKLSNAGVGVLKVEEGVGESDGFVCTISPKTEKFGKTINLLSQVLGCDISVGNDDIFEIKIK